MSNEQRTKKGIVLPVRIKGKHTLTFRQTKIISNHYLVDLKTIQKINIFSVKFDPFIPHDNSQLRNSLLNQVGGELSKLIQKPIFGGMNIYSIYDYNGEEIELIAQDYKIKIKKVKTLDLKASPQLLLSFLNHTLRGIMRKLNFVQIGKSGKFFNAKDKSNIDNLTMYNGFKSNFVSLQKGFFLRVDSAKKIVRNETVLEFIDSIYRQYKELGKQQKRMKVKSSLTGLIVMSNYGKTNYYRIKDVQFTELESIIFDNSQTKLLDYYKDKYKIIIKNLKQPLLVAEGKDKKSQKGTLLVPQLMLMTGIPQNFDQMRRKKISQSTIKNPREKIQEIEGLMHKLKNVDQLSALQEMGIKINRRMRELTASLIPSPTLQLGNRQSVDRGKQSNFQLFNKPIFASKHEINLGIIFQRGTDIKQFIDVIEKTSANLSARLKIKKYQLQRMTIQKIEDQISRGIEDGLNLCCIIIPGNMKTQYKSIKIASVKMEIVTQIVTDVKLKNKNMQSIATKVLLQIIAKRGNTLWVPKSTCKLEHTMLVGFDNSKMGSKNLLAICATINSTFSSIYSSFQIIEQANDHM